MSVIKLHHRYMLKFINELSEVSYDELSAVPMNKLLLVKDFDYITLAMPFMIKDLQKGLSIKQMTIKYMVTTQTIRTISKKTFKKR